MSTPAPQLAAPVVQMIPLAAISESKSNPRKTFNGIDELAADVKVRGILQPVLVRQRTDPRRQDDPDFELVFGARRYRAAKLAKLPALPAFVRELTDKEVLELQIVENTQRADVHPYEEANGYQRLHAEFGYSVDEIAAKVGKSRSAVYERIKLTALVPVARDAFLEGKLSASTALLIARIPDKELQARAVKDLVSGRDGPMSYRDAVDHIHRKYMLALKDAPFDVTDAALVSSAGACSTCPKRTGNQRELFGDVKSPDVCTDPKCYRTKVSALADVKLKAAEEKGKEVLRGAKAEKLFQENYGGQHVLRHDSGFVPLQSGHQYVSDRGYMDVAAAVKKNEIKTVVVADPDTGKPVELVPVKALPKAKGRTSTDYAQLNKKREEKAAKERAFGFSILAPLVKRAEKGLGKAELAAVVAALLDERRYEGACDMVERRLGKELNHTQEGKALEDLAKSLPKKPEAELRGLLLELVALGRSSFELLGKGEGNLAAVATALGVDLVGAKSAFDAAGKPAAKPGAVCAIPGCGAPGKRTKGAPGLWCTDHGTKLSATEKKSIDARNKRLAGAPPAMPKVYGTVKVKGALTEKKKPAEKKKPSKK